MIRNLVIVIVIVAAGFGLYKFTQDQPAPSPTAAVATGADNIVAPTLGMIDDERIKNAESEPGNWLAYGRTYEEQRFSPLEQINKDSVANLGLAWFKDMQSNRALESTPIVVDNMMFLTTAWSRVYALDALTGRSIKAGSTWPALTVA